MVARASSFACLSGALTGSWPGADLMFTLVFVLESGRGEHGSITHPSVGFMWEVEVLLSGSINFILCFGLFQQRILLLVVSERRS